MAPDPTPTPTEPLTELQAARIQRGIWLQLAQDARMKIQQVLTDLDTMGEAANAKVAAIEAKLKGESPPPVEAVRELVARPRKKV